MGLVNPIMLRVLEIDIMSLLPSYNPDVLYKVEE